MIRTQLRRKLSAWLLLSVFIPMMAATLLHRHEAVADVDSECVQCQHHLPHAGHLSVQSVALDDCLLCQFNTLPCLLPADVQLVVFSIVQPACQETRQSFVALSVAGHRSPRAPPVVVG